MKKLAALALSCMLIAPPAFADPAPRSEAPNTDSCPFAERPGKALTTSENLAPGQRQPPAPPTVPNEFGSCGVVAPRGYDVPDITASAWMVFDLDSGEVFATKDPHGRYRPASIIKVLLAMVALEELDLNAPYVATKADEDQEGSAVGLKEGLKYTNRQLLLGLLLNSGNDAAHALAQQLGGDGAALEKVRRLARNLGAQDTYVASYSGLDAPGMMSSAVDLARFYRAAWANPTFAEMLRTDYVEMPTTEPDKTYQAWNDNGLFLNDPDGIGGKTGYTDDARHTFVGAKKVGSRRIAAVVLDTTVDKGRAWQQAQMLIDATSNNLTATVGTLSAAVTPAPSTTLTPAPSTSASPAPAAPASPSPADDSFLYWLLGAGAALALAGVVLWFAGRPATSSAAGRKGQRPRRR